LKVLRPLFAKRLDRAGRRLAAAAALGELKPSAADDGRVAICDLYEAVLDLYERDPLRTTCQWPAELQTVDCSPQGPNESREAYVARLQQAAQLLVLLVVAYVRDCVCHAFNPPCPEDPCEDRVILGCVTLRDGKVIDICNLECRRYAGSLVSLRYWLPVGTVVSWVAGILCCFPLFARTRGRDQIRLARLLQTVDPSGNVRRLLMQDDFAMAANWRTQAQRLSERLRPSALSRLRIHASDAAVNLAQFQGQPVGDMEDALRRAGVEAVVVDVPDPNAVPLTRLGAIPVVEPGTAVRAFVSGGRVVGFAPAPPAEPASAGEVQILRDEVASLRAELARRRG
jgi:hypothetical protein